MHLPDIITVYPIVCKYEPNQKKIIPKVVFLWVLLLLPPLSSTNFCSQQTFILFAGLYSSKSPGMINRTYHGSDTDSAVV